MAMDYTDMDVRTLHIMLTKLNISKWKWRQSYLHPRSMQLFTMYLYHVGRE